MKYILQIAQCGGYRSYGIQSIDVGNIARKPTMRDAMNTASGLTVALGDSILRRCMY